jgi:transaldolase
MNRLGKLAEEGQSIWLDYIDRRLILSGKLQRMVERDGICGVTSNPAIFEKAIRTDSEYLDALQQLAEISPAAAFERLAMADIRGAAEVLYPVYERTGRRDGYVSLEVSPKLAHDTQATVEEAMRLWEEVGRGNLMIKVPATEEGIPAIRHLIAEGINVNATLLFSLAMYRHTAEAFIAGLEQRLQQGKPLAGVASVASFFVSRIDTAADAQIDKLAEKATGVQERGELSNELGKVAIANAKLAFRYYQSVLSTPRWQRLAAHGAHTQRLLWASTGTKNPAYSDCLYVEELIGPDTVNTAPLTTLEAFRDHGQVRASLEEDIAGAEGTIKRLEEFGISLDAITDALLEDGVRLFDKAYESLLDAIREATQHTASKPAY